MFEFNGVTIKSTLDLQEALKTKMSGPDFKMNMDWMIKRWGLESCMGMLGDALYGYDEIPGIIKIEH